MTADSVADHEAAGEKCQQMAEWGKDSVYGPLPDAWPLSGSPQDAGLNAMRLDPIKHHPL